MAAAAARPPMRLGKKQVFLPNFSLTLLRTPFLPPTYASFIVPLNLNKLDIKDYLYNAYGIRVLSVRSFVQQQHVRQDKPNAKNPKPRRWFRPRAIKKMTVEMERPFVWPDEPTDLSAWDKELFDGVNKAQEEEMDRRRAQGAWPTGERSSIAAEAKKLLKGEAAWKSSWEAKPMWEDVGELVEVEKHVSI